MVDISFLAVAKTNANVAAINFGDQPTLRQVSNPQAGILLANYTTGTVTIPFLGIEGDVSPLPNGDNAVTVIDWVQEGRFVAGLDTVANGGEFQRADCAPRSTLGDGSLTVADWVQVGRYAVGLDPLTAAGGPTQPASDNVAQISPANRNENSPLPAGSPARTVTVISTNAVRGQACQVSIQLNSQGNENALGYSVNFDPTVLSFVSASLGAGATGATLNVNANQAVSGTVGLALALPIGSSFTAASQEVAKLKFVVAASATNGTSISFSSTPVVKAVADAEANTLSAIYLKGTVTISSSESSSPMITISQSNGKLILAWPASATGFNLESNPSLVSSNWAGVSVTPVTNSTTISVTIPTSGTQKFYRLHHP